MGYADPAFCAAAASAVRTWHVSLDIARRIRERVQDCGSVRLLFF